MEYMRDWCHNPFRLASPSVFFYGLFIGKLPTDSWQEAFFYLHARFVIEILSGRAVPWKNQSRNPAEGLAWRDAVRLFWPSTMIGALWLALSASYASSQLVYLVPMLFSWIASIPLSVLFSNPACGRWLMHLGLFPDAFSASDAEELEARAHPTSYVGRDPGTEVSPAVRFQPLS